MLRLVHFGDALLSSSDTCYVSLHRRLDRRRSLVFACFAPWATVTTFVDTTESHGALEEAFFGGVVLLGLAGVAAVGLLFAGRR